MILADDVFQWVEGGAVVAITTAFLLILKWMLSTNTRQQKKIEAAMHVNTLTLVAVSSQLLAIDLSLTIKIDSEDAKEKLAFKRFGEVQKDFADIKKLLMTRIRQLEVDDDSDLFFTRKSLA